MTKAQIIMVSLIGVAAFAALLQTNALRQQLTASGIYRPPREIAI